MVSTMFLFLSRTLYQSIGAAMGEVWANMLHIVYAALVDRHGYSSSARTNPNGGEGNVVWLHLFMDSFAIQPCHPTCKQFPHDHRYLLNMKLPSQLKQLAMLGFRQMETDTMAPTNAFCGKRLQAEALV